MYVLATSFPSNITAVRSISAITRAKWSTPDTNSLLAVSRRLVILFRNKMSKYQEPTPAHTSHGSRWASTACSSQIETVFSLYSYISFPHSRWQIEAGNWEREERGNEKHLAVGPPAYFLLLNRFWLILRRKYSLLRLLPTQLIRPEDAHRLSNPQQPENFTYPQPVPPSSPERNGHFCVIFRVQVFVIIQLRFNISIYFRKSICGAYKSL